MIHCIFSDRCIFCQVCYFVSKLFPIIHRKMQSSKTMRTTTTQNIYVAKDDTYFFQIANCVNINRLNDFILLRIFILTNSARLVSPIHMYIGGVLIFFHKIEYFIDVDYFDFDLYQKGLPNFYLKKSGHPQSTSTLSNFCE